MLVGPSRSTMRRVEGVGAGPTGWVGWEGEGERPLRAWVRDDGVG